jgi:hypothetical protein
LAIEPEIRNLARRAKEVGGQMGGAIVTAQYARHAL